MLILIPWKPLVVGWCLLAAMLWVGYLSYSVLEGKNPFGTEPRQSHRVKASSTPHRETSNESNPNAR